MGKFIFGKSFGENNGIKRYNMRDLDTPYGHVFAYQVEFSGKPEDEKFKTVCFPLMRNLLPEDGCPVKEIGDFVPPEQRETVSEILTREGYMGKIKW
jgi:hypothetical protein